jgi:hypothetical protein
MTERPSPGEQVAGIAGLALILTMFLFAWYGFNLPAGAPHVNGLDAFDAYSDWFDIILVFAAFGGMSLALFGNGVARSPIPISVVTTVLAGVGTVILIIYIISPPGAPTFGGGVVEVGLTREFGLWLGLVELIVLAYGGYRAMQEEGVSFGGAADRLSGPDGGWPQQGQHPQQPPVPQQQPGQPYQQPAAPPPPPPPQEPPPVGNQPPPPLPPPEQQPPPAG